MIPIRGSVRSVNLPIVTLVLIAVNVLFFLIQTSLSRWELTRVIQYLGLIPARQWAALREAPQAVDLWLLPLFSSMFLHGGWVHLIGNMVFLWVFGDGIENRLGKIRFFLFYLCGGVAAGLVQSLAQPRSFLPMIGASGAVAAVLGAYLILYPWSWITVLVPVFFWPLFFEIPAIFFLGFWFLEQVWLGTLWSLSPYAGLAGGVAWWAHAGGFAAGAMLIALIPRRPHPGFWDRGRFGRNRPGW
ncbi:MAG: rhomboid family intramembrane serine protease [Bradymonadales bacterium]|nr:rhomboid family intramembrane serine protease [Bradymonadales bacterium]